MGKYQVTFCHRFIFVLLTAVKKPFKINQLKLFQMKNRVQLIGHLGADPEIKKLEDGRKHARINIATNETYTNAKGEKVTETQWHHVVAWGKTAELAEKLFAKGMEVLIDGKLINRSFTDKDGNKRYITEVQANELLIFSKKP
jgi:single-strand DNA-binding protein